MEAELYDKLGGKQGVKKITQHFFLNFLKDDLLRPFFEKIDIKQQEQKMNAFLSYAFGSDSLYAGKSLRRAHSGLVLNQGLSTVHFDAMIGCMEMTLREQKIAEELLQEVMIILKYQRNNILGESSR